MERGTIILLFFVTAGAEAGAKNHHGLFVPANAVDVTRNSTRETKAVSYYVREPYPASATLSFIQESLRANGWEPLAGKDAQPHEPSSLDTGWNQLPSADFEGTTRLWLARWRQRSTGDEVTYTLIYAPPRGPAGLQAAYVGVAGLYCPRKFADHTRRVIEEEMARGTEGRRAVGRLRPERSCNRE